MTTSTSVWITLPSGETTIVGRLNVFGERMFETSDFIYDNSWLERSDAFSIDPFLPLSADKQQFLGHPSWPGAIDDACPDAWGTSVIDRRYRGCTFGDYLTLADDDTRMGALRLHDGNDFVARSTTPLPDLTDVEQLISEVGVIEDRQPGELDLLLEAGSSLGGARPKANLTHDGSLWIAKFPRGSDLYDVEAFEHMSLGIAREAGIVTPATKLIRIDDDRSVLLLERFDRTSTGRIPYMSAKTMLGYVNDHSYEDLSRKLKFYSPDPASERALLFDRVALSILLNNTDDHMKNTGFLRTERGWELSPIFDVLPYSSRTPHGGTPLTRTTTERSITHLVAQCSVFGLDEATARDRLTPIVNACSQWEQYAEAATITDIHELRILAELDERVTEARRLIS